MRAASLLQVPKKEQQERCWSCAGTSRASSSHSKLPAKKGSVTFGALAERMRAQLHSVMVLSMHVSAIITGPLPWVTTVALDPGCSQGHHYAKHLKNTNNLKSLHPKGASFPLRTAKQWSSLLAVSIFRGFQDRTGQSPGQPSLISLLAMLEQVVRPPGFHHPEL